MTHVDSHILLLLISVLVRELCGAQVIAEHTALTGIQQIAPK
jgi:hypothetical protein